MVKIIEYLQKYKKLIITVVCIIILAIIGKVLFDNYALADIKVTTVGQQNNSSNIKVFASTDTKTIELGGPGLKIIPRKTKSLIATQDENASTQVKIQIPWHGLFDKTISLTPSKNADKIAYLNTSRYPCATYSVRLASLLSYDCKKPDSLVRYDTSTRIWGSKRISSLIFRDGLVAPYMGGLIGIEYGLDSISKPLVIVRDDGVKTRFDLPPGMTFDNISQAKIFTNNFDTADGRFVIVDYTGNIHLGTPSLQNKSISYKTISSPSDYSFTYQQTLCGIVGDFVNCYRGQHIRGDLPPESVKLPDESIVTASFTNDDVTTRKLDSPGRYSDFYVTLDGDMYGKNYKKIFYLSSTGDTYKARELAQNVDGAVGGEGLFYIQRNAIYNVKKDGDAIMTFYSKNILPKSLYISEGSVFILGTIENGGNNVHAYKLNDQEHTGGSRLIDLLPAGSGKLPAVTYQNLVGNQVQFTLAIPINKTTRAEINTPEFEIRRNKVLDTLRNWGADLTKIDATFNY